MQTQILTGRGPIDRTISRSAAAAASAIAGLTLVALACGIPWLTLFRGLAPQPGFLLDGGKLAGLGIAAAAALLVGARLGGGTALRLFAVAGSGAIVVDSLLVGFRIAAYVADPGPAGPLTQPSAGGGAFVMAIGGILLLVAALIVPLAHRRLSGTLAMGLALGAVVFIPGWIHLLLTPEHIDESLILGSGFLVSGLAQVGLAALAIARPRNWVLYLIVAVNVGLIAIYANAVLVGLPIGSDDHHVAGLMIGSGEPIDMFGAITTISQIAGVALAVTLLGRPSGDTRWAPPPRR